MKRKYLITYSFLTDARHPVSVGRTSNETDHKIESSVKEVEKKCVMNLVSEMQL